MERYPLLLTYRDVFAGRGFVAGIEARGRALLVNETDADGGWVLYGVNPGGLAGCGADRPEAMRDFRRGYQSVLLGMVEDAMSCDELSAQVRRFFFEDSDTDQWLAAVQDVREGTLTVEWAGKEDAERPIDVRVLDLTSEATATPDRNRVPLEPELSVAA